MTTTKDKTTAIDTNIQFDLQPENVKRAVERLINGFGEIDGEWLRIIAEAKGDDFYPCMWNAHWIVKNQFDRSRMEKMLVQNEDEESEEYGMYEVGDTGITAQYVDDELILGVNGCGYDFYTAHWLPLYISLGYSWH